MFVKQEPKNHLRTLFSSLYESTGRAITVTMVSMPVSALPMVKDFKTLHLMNLWFIEDDRTCPDVRCWSEILCCTIPIHDE